MQKFNSKNFEEYNCLPWLRHYQEGLAVLCDHEPEDNDTDGLGFVDEGWLRPSGDTDKLYMSMGGGQWWVLMYEDGRSTIYDHV